MLLKQECLEAWHTLNPEIPAEKLEEAFRVLQHAQGANAVFRNKAVHQLLIEGIRVEVDKHGQKEQELVIPIDFKEVRNNRFLVVNQFSIAGHKQTRRPDILVFVW